MCFQHTWEAMCFDIPICTWLKVKPVAFLGFTDLLVVKENKDKTRKVTEKWDDLNYVASSMQQNVPSDVCVCVCVRLHTRVCMCMHACAVLAFLLTKMTGF